MTNPRNDVAAVAGAYKDLKELFTRTEGLAKGTWSTPAEEPSHLAGYRRYGASKLCEIMFLFVPPSFSRFSVPIFFWFRVHLIPRSTGTSSRNALTKTQLSPRYPSWASIPAPWARGSCATRRGSSATWP